MYEEFKGIEIERPKKHINNEPWTTTMSLADLYRDGWWVTEIFGSHAVCVRRSQAYKTKRPYFCCLHLFIDTSQITPKAEQIIKRIQKRHWKKYGPMLTTENKMRKIKNK